MTTTHYRIYSSTSGATLGVYPGSSREDALDSMARDAGYSDHAAASAATGDDGAHLVVEPIVEVAREHGKRAGRSDYESRAGDVIVHGEDVSWAWPLAEADSIWINAVGTSAILAECGYDLDALDLDDIDAAWELIRDAWCEAFRRGYVAAREADGGHLDLDWIASCRANEGGDETLEAWICRALNCREASVGRLGSVWIADAQSGHWLSQDECDELQAMIDAGV